jgi:hypothetical protein
VISASGIGKVRNLPVIITKIQALVKITLRMQTCCGDARPLALLKQVSSVQMPQKLLPLLEMMIGDWLPAQIDVEMEYMMAHTQMLAALLLIQLV